jgi:hypothetical protein
MADYKMKWDDESKTMTTANEGLGGRRNTDVYFFFSNNFTKGEERKGVLRIGNNSFLCIKVSFPSILFSHTSLCFTGSTFQ